MTRKWFSGGAIVLVFAGAILASYTVQAQTEETPPPAMKSPKATDSSAQRGIESEVISSLLSHFVAPRGVAPSASPKSPPRTEGPARIWLRVPRDAKVWFNGQETTLTGRHRRFFSPTLLPGKVYTYKIRVRWMKEGKAVEEVRNIEFRAGESVPIDFIQPDDRTSANTRNPKMALSIGGAR